MKKNRMMRLASVLLVLVLLTTSVISGTFAKYTTQDSASDAARVAKWGVELQVVGNLYGETYANKDNGNKILVDNASENFTVQSKAATEDVVAPGTKNEDGFTFSLQGTPEVAGEVTATLVHENIYLNAGNYGVMVEVPTDTIDAANYNEFYVAGSNELWTGNKGGDYALAAATFDPTATYFTLEDYVELSVNYYPVEYAMFGTGDVETSFNKTYGGALTIDTLAGLSEVIGTCFGTTVTNESIVDGRTSKTYSGTTFLPNADLQTVVKLGNQEINWKWDFCQADTECEDGNAACNACKADTILGNLMAGDALNGEVVKVDGTTAKAPLAASGTDLNNYNLESYFSLDITVTQVD